MTDIWQDRRTAYHEADHAVVGWVLGYRVLSIRLRAEGKVQGETSFDTRHPPWQLSCIVDAKAILPDIAGALQVLVFMAGIGAELQLGPCDEVLRDYASVSERGLIPNDHVQISKLLCPERGYRRADVDTMVRPLLAACRRIVERHWLQIERLAAALLADGRIVGRREMRAILGRRRTPLRKLILAIAILVAAARVEMAHPS